MNRTAIVVTVIAVLSLSSVGAVFAYSAIYEDVVPPAPLPTVYATLGSSDFDGSISLDGEGNLVFGPGSSDTLSLIYSESTDSPCYVNVKVGGLGIGNTLYVTLVQTISGVDLTFSGSSVVDSDGNAYVSGLGILQVGNISLSANVTGAGDNAGPLHLNIIAYPQAGE